MKTAIVTGASTGIGRAVSFALSQNNFHVYLVARRQNALEETKNIIEENGGQATIISGDLSQISEVNELIKTLKEQITQVNLIANIAGIWHGVQDVYAGKDFETFEQQIIVDTINVGTVTPILLAHALVPLMPAGSKIINLSGTFENGGKGWLPYFVSKRAIEDLTVGLAQELADKEIQVNCISPSDTATESYAKFFPQYMEDAISPEEIAQQFVKLSKTENRTTGKIFVMRKGQEVREDFHF